MLSDKQLTANQKNALLSTGPKTARGKSIVATNAIKHGIFTTDLITSSTLAKEDGNEYQEMLNNLIVCLSPKNQLEALLAEKIAVDFWRLRRVIRFETGSIEERLTHIFKDFYSYSRKNNAKIDQEIEDKKASINWIGAYLKCLKKEEVDFVCDDFYLILGDIEDLSCEEEEKLHNAPFEEMKTALIKYGYASKKEISEKLIELYLKERTSHENDIEELERTKSENIKADKLNNMLGAVPIAENAEKILKYERSIQKSIFQNLLMLKKLQGIF